MIFLTVAETNLEKAKAKQEITKSIRDLVTFNITLPLGNPNHKLIHTNKFITTTFPSDFKLENFGIIAQKLNSSDNRYSKYNKYNWYVEAVTITNDGNNAKIELDLNPFATSIAEYKDAYQSFDKAYRDAVNKNNTTTNTTSTTTKTNNVKTKGTTGSAKIDKVVEQAIKGKTKPLAIAKAVDKAFKNHIIYSYYYNAQKTGGNSKRYESAWKNAHLNCADGANILCAMFNYAGIPATIIHVPSHYIVRVKVNGKYYYTDNASSSGNHTTRPFGKTWKGMTRGSNAGKSVQ